MFSSVSRRLPHFVRGTIHVLFLTHTTLSAKLCFPSLGFLIGLYCNIYAFRLNRFWNPDSPLMNHAQDRWIGWPSYQHHCKIFDNWDLGELFTLSPDEHFPRFWAAPLPLPQPLSEHLPRHPHNPTSKFQYNGFIFALTRLLTLTTITQPSLPVRNSLYTWFLFLSRRIDASIMTHKRRSQ